MYPDQREMETFSGRFWQAPIAGTPLLSDPSRWARQAPGVFESDLGDRQVLKDKQWEHMDHDSIAKQSRLYWSALTDVLFHALKDALKDKVQPAKRLPNPQIFGFNTRFTLRRIMAIAEPWHRIG
jgi:hypothetical protein